MAYSYHTFIFPFLWNDGKKNRKDFEKTLHKNWEKITTMETDDGKNFVASYNQYRYFNAAARNAIYSCGKDSDAVWNYMYKLQAVPTDEWVSAHPNEAYVPCYEIEKEGKVLYALQVNSIRLKLFASGIGIVIFELENKNYEALDDVNTINELGRQIYKPFIANTEGDCFASPDAIVVRYPDGKEICGGVFGGKPQSVDELVLAKTVTDLLSSDTCCVTADKKLGNTTKDKTYFYIEPVLDERMFVVCYYINADFVDACRKWNGIEYAYLAEAKECHPGDKENVAAKLYRTLYIDGNSTTCQSRLMMGDLLKKAIYDRWVEEGSLTGVTDYSLVCVTNSTADYLIRNFTTEYVEMLILVLAQRASLRNYENMISNSVMKQSDISKIHESYISFQSQLLLHEVTSQQQGIELYTLMRKNLFIAEQVAEVDEHLEALFTQKSSGNESKENFILFIIAVLAMLDPINTVFSWLSVDISAWLKGAVFAAWVLLATGFYLHKRK